MSSLIQKYIDQGYCVFNTGSSEKKVFTPWTRYKTEKPNEEQIQRWLLSPNQNWAIVCGKISGLVVFDVDTKNGGDPTPFLNRGFYEVRTPSGGYHFYTKYNPLLSSTRHEKKPNKDILHAVDVQSNGSIVFAPPSKFKNGTYTIVNDAPIIPLPDDLLVQVIDALEPEKESTDKAPYHRPIDPLSKRPGDIFNALATWEDVLVPLGWKRLGTSNYWRRPGKKDGVSASTDWNGYGLFFCYSTSVEGLTQFKGYTKFSLYTHLVHGGDFKKAASALVMENYRIAHNLVNRHEK